MFALVALLVALGIRDLSARGAVAIEAMLGARVENGLDVLGLDWARVAVDGLIVELSGDAPDVDSQALAVEASRSLARLGRVIDGTTARLAPPERREPIELEFHLDDNALTLMGRVHDEQMRNALIAQVRKVDQKLEIDDLTGIDAARPPAGWGGEIAVALAVIDMMPRAFVRVTPGSVFVEGVAADLEARDAMETELLKLAGPDIKLVTAIRVPGRVITPFSFVTEKSRDGVMTLVVCSARTEAEAVEIDTIRKEMQIAGGPARCPAGLGGPHGEWVSAVRAALGALAALPAGRVEVTYRSVTLDALPPTSTERFEAALASLSIDLPPGFDLSGAVAAGHETERAAREKESYWMRLTRLGERLTLEGRVEDAVAATALSSVASSRLGRDAVESDLRAADVTPPAGWQEAALAALEALTEFRGTAELTARGLILTAKLPGARAARELHDRIAERMPETIPLRTQFRVDLPSMIRALPLDPDRCVAELNRAVMKRGVLFDPGSARIDSGSRDDIRALASILRRCPEVAVEIGGHTDNQGREELNEQLSESRAEAVLDALVDEGIRIHRLDAKGYGEHDPIATNDTPEGRARNRRIAFKLKE